MSAMVWNRQLETGLGASRVRACLPWTLAVFAMICTGTIVTGAHNKLRAPDGGFVSLGVPATKRSSMLAPSVLMLLIATFATFLPLAVHLHMHSRPFGR